MNTYSRSHAADLPFDQVQLVANPNVTIMPEGTRERLERGIALHQALRRDLNMTTIMVNHWDADASDTIPINVIVPRFHVACEHCEGMQFSEAYHGTPCECCSGKGHVDEDDMNRWMFENGYSENDPDYDPEHGW